MKKLKELLPLALILLVMAVLLLSARNPSVSVTEADNYKVVHSSYSTVPEGYKALYLTLNDLGYQAKRQTRPFDLMENGLLIIADPYTEQISELDARSLFAWVQQGNRVLFMVENHPEAVNDLVNTHEIKKKNNDDYGDHDTPWLEHVNDESPTKYDSEISIADYMTSKKASVSRAIATANSSLNTTAPAISIKSRYRFSNTQSLPQKLLDLLQNAPKPEYSDDKGIALMSSEYGKGKIFWCTSPWSFSNEGIKEENNLDLVLAIAGNQKGGVVLFDEYHHGFGRNISVFTLLPRLTNLGLLQILLAMVLLGLTLAWRFGPARLPEVERFTRSRAEYLTSMAGLLERAHATHVVRDRLDTLLRRRLCRRLGLTFTATANEIIRANSKFILVDQKELEHVLYQLQTLADQKRPEMSALVNLAHDIHLLLHMRQHGINKKM